MIMLITALWSLQASALLISEWGDALRVVQTEQRAATERDGVSVALAGDHAMVAYNNTTDTITLYFVNTGEFELDTSTLEVLIDGEAPTSSSTSVYPQEQNGTQDTSWKLITDTTWNFADGDDVSVYFVSLRTNQWTCPFGINQCGGETECIP